MRNQDKKRQEKIKEYGLEFVEANEAYWEQEGYKLDYVNDRLVKIED